MLDRDKKELSIGDLVLVAHKHRNNVYLDRATIIKYIEEDNKMPSVRLRIESRSLTSKKTITIKCYNLIVNVLKIEKDG